MITERPEVGDVLIFGEHRNTSRHWLVVESARRHDRDILRGDAYWVEEFAVVPLEYTTGDLADPELGPGPFLESYLRGDETRQPYNEAHDLVRYWISTPSLNGGMTGRGKSVTLDRISVIGNCNVTRKVQTSYGFTHLKYL